MSSYIKLDTITNIIVQNIINNRKTSVADLVDIQTIEVSEDAISREYMLRALNGYGKDWQEDCEIAEIIRNAPSVVPSRAEGKWVKQGLSPYEGVQRCSLCGNVYNITEDFNYCPNCGARMKGASDEIVNG